MTDTLDHIQIDDLPEDCRQVAEIIGLDGLLALSGRMGGERIYIPSRDRLGVCARNRAIRDEFNGRNYLELAVKYNLTARWVRVIVSGADPEETPGVNGKKVYIQQKLF